MYQLSAVSYQFRRFLFQQGYPLTDAEAALTLLDLVLLIRFATIN